MAQPSDNLATEIRRLPIAQLRHLEVNARYMTADQQMRLTENIKRDGGLTSLPLVWLEQTQKGKPINDPATYLIVSGNHRVFSAREAGLAEIDCIVITNWVSEARRIEIQLAHNAVSGQDDLSILEQLYEGLDLSGKEYSGITDDLFKSLKELSISGFSVDGPEYQEITLTFLPEDADQFIKLVDRAQKNSDGIFKAAHLDDFSKLFDAIVRTKDELNIQNNAVAVHALAELAHERLDQIEAERAAAAEKDEAGEVVE